jgi:hypothetical protein
VNRRFATGLPTALAALTLTLAACSSTGSSGPAASSSPASPAQATATPTLQTGIAHATPSAAVIAQRMHLTKVTVYDAKTDPNHLLGRQGGYTSKIAGEGWDKNSPSAGVSIEVFPTNAALITRADTLKRVRRDGPGRRIRLLGRDGPAAGRAGRDPRPGSRTTGPV